MISDEVLDEFERRVDADIAASLNGGVVQPSHLRQRAGNMLDLLSAYRELKAENEELRNRLETSS